jgi:hypothetical protein
MSALKVYGWSSFSGRTQTREIAAAHSLAEVARLAGYRRPTQLFQLGVTANGPEVAQAMEHPGVVFWRPLDERSASWRRRTPALETTKSSLDSL